MPSRHEIVSFRDDAPPDATPWLPGGGPRVGVMMVDPDPAWPGAFEELADRVRGALGARVISLEHVGSTAVPGLPGKPVIDMDLTVADPHDETAYVPALEAVGFQLRVREPWWYGHRGLRADAPVGFLHVFGPDSPGPVRHRIFRDRLRRDAADRERYAEAKRVAAEAANERGEHTMDYNARKEQVVREIYARAFVAAGLLPGGSSRPRERPAVALRPVTGEDLLLPRGGDSPFDDFGPRAEPTEPPGADLTDRGALTVVTMATDEVLGHVNWHQVRWGPNPESSNPMIGVWLRRDARGRGVGSIAQRMLVDRFFTETSVHRVEAHTDVANLAEQRALEKAGFTREGTTRSAQWRTGAFHDGHLYSVLRSEWRGPEGWPDVDPSSRGSTSG